MVKLLPQLPRPAARFLIDHFLTDGPANWTGFDPDDLPNAVRYAPTGGSPADPKKDLVALRDTLARKARANGFGVNGGANTYASFDGELGSALSEMPLLSSGEALRDDFWTFVGISLAPDVVYWRFGAAPPRFLGGVRNTFQRLWLRARALDRGEGHPQRWGLLHELTEDALVQITERPSIGADPALASAVAEAWLRAKSHYGKGAMESIMRRAILRVRMQNEIRSLVDLPTDALARVLDRAFGVPVADRRDAASAAEEASREDRSRTDVESRSGDARTPSTEPSVVDSRPPQWEEKVRDNGRGTLRYMQFRATVAYDASGALMGKIVNEDGWRIAMVTADTLSKFKREMQRKVDAYLSRGAP